MDKQHSTQDQQAARDPLMATRALSADALARRRMLLKGAGAGSAATLAALAPMRAMAGNGVTLAVCSSAKGTGKAVICTISGVQSAAHSFHGETLPNAWGYSPGWWGQCTTISGVKVPTRTWPCASNVTVGSVLIRAAEPIRSVTLLTLMTDHRTYASTPERHWLCAYLNALAYETNTGWDKGRTGFAFPYSSTDVINFYLTSNADAYSFFTTYLEK